MSVRWKILALTINLVSWLKPSFTLALPPVEDIPEEVLRTEIILEGRSPIDGIPLSAGEYEELQAQLAQSTYRPQIKSDIQHLIFLLQIRKFVKTIIPFY
ncbi:MAG: hypothetical protein QNJ53_17355 [Pleurocapsa sp. MO_192.B19]|nr:hypothetical protein [Pleurocapsa sp. MO_192.B19]